MKILIFSDSHGAASYMRLAALLENAGSVLFLGDGEADIRRLETEIPGLYVEAVRGNCDMTSELAETRLLALGGKRVMMTHGHRYGVKSDYDAVIAAAKRDKADLLLFGHTHTPVYDMDDGLHVLNPGSIAGGRYAVVEIEEGRISCHLKSI